jgi:FkbM family methyltransferase
MFLDMIPERGTMLDVGANMGVTCAIAKRNRPDINLIAFEPVPQNLTILHRIQSIYSVRKMTIHPFAIGDSEGVISIAVPSANGVPITGLSHVISSEFKNQDVERHPFAKVDVSMRTLDSLSLERVDAIKIDVEDYEYHVVNGAKQLLQTFQPIVFCELWDTPNRRKTIDFMTSMGYSVTQKGIIDFLFIPLGTA